MPRINGQGVNKEKLIFLATAAGFSWGLYVLLTSTPVQLHPGDPVTTEPPPAPLKVAQQAERLPAEFYVVDGWSASDPRTLLALNRGRKTPFAPASDFRFEKVKTEVAVAPTKPAVAPPPPLPEPPPPAKDEKTGKKWIKDVAASKVEYVGVVMMNGETFGLLKPKDGSGQMRIKKGDMLPGLDYTVDRIEKQAIYVSDAEGRPFVVRDTRFAEDDAASTDAEKDKDEAEAPAKPAAKPEVKPETKHEPVKPVAPAAAQTDTKRGGPAAVEDARARRERMRQESLKRREEHTAKKG